MEIIDKTNQQKEQWQLGDVLVTNTGNIGIIVKNNHQKYYLMHINPGVEWAYSTSEDDTFVNYFETLEKLHKKILSYLAQSKRKAGD